MQAAALTCEVVPVQAVYARGPWGQQETEAEESGIPAEPQ